MRQKPKEFGLGVRDVQASPVDTFSPEVVMQPRAARGGAVGSALSGLSQTLAGMANQNKQFDDKTLQPLAQAVYAMREDGKTDSQIAKEVAESGMTSARVMKKIRSRGGFDAFTEPAFRLTYDELEGVGTAERAESTLAALDASAERMLAGIGIEDDRDEVVAMVEAMYREALEPFTKGLSPFALSAFSPRVERSVTRRMNKAYGQAQRTQEQNAASLVVTEAQGLYDVWFEGGMDGDELTASLTEVWKTRGSAMNPIDIPRIAQSQLEAARAYLSAAKGQLSPSNPEDAEEIQEFITSIEESFPEEVLADYPDVTTDLTKLRADFTATDRQLRAFREQDEQSNLLRPHELMAVSVRVGSTLGVDGTVKGYEVASAKAREILERVPSMSDADKKIAAESFGLAGADQLDQALVGLMQEYDSLARRDEADALNAERVASWRAGQAREATSRGEAEVSKMNTESFSRIAADLAFAEGSGQVNDVFDASASEMGNLPPEMRLQLYELYQNRVSNPEGRKVLVGQTAPAVAVLKQQMYEQTFKEVEGEYGEGVEIVSSVAASNRLRMDSMIESEAAVLMSEYLMDATFDENIQDPTHYKDRLAADLPARVQEAVAREALHGDGAPYPSYNEQIGAPEPVGWLQDGGAVNRENIGTNAAVFSEKYFGDNIAKQQTLYRGVKGAYETTEILRTLPAFVSQGITGSSGSAARNTVQSYMSATSTLVDMYEDGALTEESEAALEAWSTVMRDGGLMSIRGGSPVGAFDAIIESLSSVEGEAALKVNEKAIKHFETLRDMTARVSPITSGKTEAMSIRFGEFQPGGAFSGILSANTQGINPDFERTFTDDTGASFTIDRSHVYETVRNHLRINAGFQDPSDSLVREFILRQAYQFR